MPLSHAPFVGALFFLAFSSASPQASNGATGSAPVRRFETRAELDSRAREAEAANRTGEAWLLRSRLERGDFQEGDRIALTILTGGRAALADTLTVRDGKTLQLPGMEDFSLAGVLRSELSVKLTDHVGRFLREPTLRAVPLIRLAVLGRIGRPGFYYAAADAVLSDVIMLSGGPAPGADLARIEIRRSSEIIWGRADTRVALSEGLSLDRLHLRAGDEIFVGEEKRIRWSTIIPTISSIAALVLALVR